MRTYTTKSGDMWDSVAHKMLGSTDHTDKLMRENLQYRAFYLFPSGIVLKLPEIPEKESESLPPWKRGSSV